MLSPRVAYLLAYAPARLVAIDQSSLLLERLSTDPLVATDRDLAHAVAFLGKANVVERKIALDHLRPFIEQVSGFGLEIPSLPERADEWLPWRGAVDRLVATNADEIGAIALSLARHGFELLRAWSYAAHLAYLLAARSTHPVLLAELSKTRTEAATAWNALEQALGDTGRPLLELRLRDLSKWILRAPSMDGPKPPSSKEIYRWIETFEVAVGEYGLAKDLDAPIDPPPSSPPTAEEERLLSAIIANPDDDEPRLRFAELAALRNDPRAALIRDQFEILEDAPNRPYERVRQRIGSHPEWSAPFVALGATEVKFERGFVNEIEIEADAFVANANVLFALAPITVVRIRGGLAGRGAKLASVSQLGQVHTLDLTTQGVTDDDITAIVQSGHVGQLWELALSENPITAAGVEAIAAATHSMPELTAVNLQITRAVDPCDRFVYYNETQGEYVPTPEGKALEAKHGPLPWLHAQQTVLRLPVARQRAVATKGTNLL